MPALSRMRGAILGTMALVATLILPTIASISAQRVVPIGTAARLEPRAPAATRAAFVAAAEANAGTPTGVHRYIVVYREATAFAGLRDGPLPVVRGNVIVATGARIARARGVRSVRRIGNWPIGIVETDDAEAAAELADDPNVAIVEQDQLYEMLFDDADLARLSERNILNRVAQTTPWGVAMVGAPSAWTRGARGQGVKVGILDSGGDSDHPDLVWAGGFDATSSTVKSWEDVSPCNGHGTHVAGTVAALDNDIGVVGVAPEAQLYAVRVFENVNGNCSAWTSSQINGLNWMGTQGVRVANASIGGSYNASYNSAVYTLRQNGLLLVAASGNNGEPSVRCPSCYNSSVAVGGLTQSKTRAGWSNYGNGLQFMAPGEGITSTMPGGGTGGKSGTSMASPHVAGAVAVLLSSRPGMSLNEALQRLAATTEDLNTPGWDATTAYGLVRADQAVDAVLGVGMVASTAEPVVRLTSVAGTPGPTAVETTILLSGPEAMADGWYPETPARYVFVVRGTGSTLANDWDYGSRTVRLFPLSTMINTTTPAGVYADTILIRRGSTNAIIGRIPVEITITQGSVTATNVSLSPPTLTTTVRQDSVPMAGASTMTITGTNASSTTWTMTTTGRFSAVTTPSGTGDATVRWNRQIGSLGVGLHVDTLRLQIAGNSGPLQRTIIDSLMITAAPAAPVAVTLDPPTRNRTLLVGTSVTDSVLVTLTGGTGTPSWTATTSGSGLTLTRNTGTSGAYAVFTRTANSEGQSTATITVTSGGSTATYTDLATGITSLTLAVAPTGRARVMLPGAVSTDSVAVTLSGTGAATTAWTATSSGQGLNVMSPTATGSGWVTFTRSASAATAGVATITIAGGGLTASYTDTLTLLAPLTIAVAPTGSARALLSGAVDTDSVAVTFTGTGATSAPWIVSSSGQGLAVATPSGTGPGWVSFTRTASQSTTGVATLTVTSGAVSASYADTLTLLAPLTLAVSPTGRTTTALLGATSRDSIQVVFAGTGAGAAPWTATSAGGPDLVTTSGEGSGWLVFNRTVIDTIQQVGTIRVTSGQLEATYTDTLQGLAPLTLALNPIERARTLSLGDVITDSVAVLLQGTGATTTTWSATTTSSDLTLNAGTGTGSGWVTFTRRATTPGTQVATIIVTAAALQAAYQDAATVTVPIAVQVAPTHRSRAMNVGATLSDSVQLTLTGTGASEAGWVATSSDPTLLALSTASGTGSGWLRFERRAPAEGASVATVQVAAGTGGATYTDSTVATAPITMVLSPTSGFTTAIVGTNRPDSIAIEIQGTDATTTPWTASSVGDAIALSTTTGTGSGWVRFTRATPAEGTIVGTITVQVGDLTQTYTDTLIGTVSLALTVTPTEHRRTLFVGTEAVDSFAVTITGTGASEAAWTASAEGTGLTLLQPSGTGSGWVSYRRTALVEGEQTAQVRVTSGTLEGTGRDIVTGTLPVTLAIAPTSRQTTLTVGAIQTDSIAIQIGGTGGATTSWTATADGDHLATTRPTGTGSGWATFTRTALREGSMTGTITVRAGNLEATFSDTLVGTIQLALQVSPMERTRTLLVGAEAIDSFAVALTGTGSAATTWDATSSGDGLAVLRESGVGSGWVTYRRTALVEGEQTAQVTVTSGALSATVRDIMTGTRALTLVLNPTSRQSSALVGVSTQDSIAVELGGTGADSVTWSATTSGASTTLVDESGIGSKWLRFTRTASTEGTVVDTIAVRVGALTATYIDILSSNTALAAVVVPATHFTSIRTDSTPATGAAQVLITGTGASTTAWAMSGGRWTTPTTVTGVGSASLGWTRNTTGLAYDVLHVDTLWVAIAGPQGELRRSIIDSLQVRSVPIAITLSPTGRSRELLLANAETPASFQITVSGSGATTTPWTATSLTPGLAVDSTEGLGSQTVGYRWTGATAAGRLIGSIRVALAANDTEYVAEFTDTLVVLVPPPSTNTVLAATPDSLETRSVPGSAMRVTRTVQVTPLGTNVNSARWRARRFGGAGMVSVGSGWRTGPGTLSFTTSHGSKTPEGSYVDTLIVERLDALDKPLYIIHTLRIANASQDRVAFLAPSAVSSYRADHKLVDPIVRTIGFTIDHLSGVSDSSWSARHSGQGPFDISGNTRRGTGVAGYVTYTRNSLPSPTYAGGWAIDTLWVLVAGREHMYLDSLQVTPTPTAYSGPLGVTHNQASRYWSTPEGTDTRFNARLTITPTGSGADTLLWRTRVWAGSASPHSGTGAGTSKGLRSIIVWVDLNRAVGVHVDTIQTALLFDQRVGARSLDTLEVIAAPTALLAATANEAWPEGLPLVGIPQLPVAAGEHPVALGRGVSFHQAGANLWQLTLTDESEHTSAIQVYMATSAGDSTEEESRQVTVPIYRLDTLPTRRELLSALGQPESIIARWADALADGDGRFTLGDALRLFSHLRP